MMNRREFVATSASGMAGLGLTGDRSSQRTGQGAGQDVRSMFPRLEREVFVNGAGGTPLGSFAEEGLRRYTEFMRHGPGDGRGDYVGKVKRDIRGLFARLVGARESEVGLVHCTKAGEQILIDQLTALQRGGNIVTNDLHFAGSLHNYVGLRRAGRDVRIVRADDFDISLERMADAIDEDTALVAVSLVSNVNGRIEPMAELARLAHERGAVVFADIIQAVGAIPLDLHGLGVDAAACSSYKWLFGVHGAGFLFVSDELQGSGKLPDRLFPGNARRNYGPYVPEIEADAGDYTYSAPADARRYQPGHVSYLGYAAVHEGLQFLAEVGVPKIQAHAARLNRRLMDQLDPDEFRILSTHRDSSPILSLEVQSFEGLRDRLLASDVVISIGGDTWNQVRISPAIYNTEADMDRVAEVLRG